MQDSSAQEGKTAANGLERLLVLETIFGTVKEAWIKGGKALGEILEQKLWRRKNYKSEEEYLRKRWNLSRSEAYYKAQTAKIAEVVGPTVQNNLKPSHYAAVRGYDPDFQKLILDTAAETAPNGKVTVDWIEKTAQRLDDERKAAIKEVAETRRRQLAEADSDDEETTEETEGTKETPSPTAKGTIQQAASDPISTSELVNKKRRQAKKTIAKLERLALDLNLSREDLLEQYDRGEL